MLLVVLDTTRADYFSCYGHERQTSPRIDRLAEEGVRYGRAYSTCSWTLPSHASLLTGLYPTETQATSETGQLRSDVTTIAERLKENGYHTGAVVCNAYVSVERGFGQGFADFAEMWRDENRLPPDGVSALTEQAAVDRAVAWIDRKAATKAPFFLFVNFNVAHLPYKPELQFREKFMTRDWAAERIVRAMTIVGVWKHLVGRLRLDETDYQIMRELYEGEVATADAQVGALIDALLRRSLLDDTLVIVTSDHGENIGDHGKIDHLLSMYDSTLHVPLVVRYPRRFEAGTVNDELVSLVDVVPTVMDVCGLPDDSAPPGAERISLLSLEDLPRSFVVAEDDRPIAGIKLLKHFFPSFDTNTIDHRSRVIRTSRHKLIWEEDFKVQLFDVQSDPGETRDLAASHPEIRERLLSHLKGWMANVKSGRHVEEFESNDNESIQRLRSLGYID
ncbi:MAG: sulfatase [Phycisphaerae bacterium]|nr:sulfatase [Phycisphaerae bacterium]